MDQTNELIQVVQLPEITEKLHQLKEVFEHYAMDAESMVCTPDTIQAVKGFRADMRKAFDSVEDQRKAAKKAIMEPYDQLEVVYRECVAEPFRRADAVCSRKVSEVEGDLKNRCEAGLKEYFGELCAVHHLDWLTYERAGVKVDMASAKAKTPKKLQEQLAAFVAGVAESVDRINSLEDAGEIMVEYQKSLDAAGAICTVKERHRRIEEAKAMNQARSEIRAVEEEHVRRVEAFAPPVAVKMPEKDPNEIIPRCTFTAYDAPRRVLWAVKEIFEKEGIRYE